MEKKYSKKLILDYISANDINEYTLDELENDYIFMIEVIKYTKDKKMYDFASSSVKKNYDFVKFIIEYFKYDTKFIKEVADYYLDDSKQDSNDTDKLELNIIMKDLIIEKSDKIKYEIYCTMYYENLINELKNELSKDKSNFGLGFIVIYEMFLSHPIIVHFLANKMINDIFLNNKYTLEEMLHKTFKTKQEVYNKGVINFILDYIGTYDGSLLDYASVNTNLIKEYEKSILFYLNNWDVYEKNNNERKISIIWQEGLNEYEKYECIFEYSFIDYLYYVLKKLNLDDIFKKYDLNYEENYNINIINKNDFTFQDISFINYLENLVGNLFSDIKIDTKPIDYDEKTPGKIVKL